MRKELIIATVSAILGGGVAIGVEYLKARLFPPDNQLSQNVAELSVVGKELVLEQKALSVSLRNLAAKTQGNPLIDVEITNITNRISNIVSTVAAYESKAREVSSLAIAAERQVPASKFNASADVALRQEQGVTVCGEQNTLAVLDRSGLMHYSLNGTIGPLTPGQELPFVSSTGKSMVGYLGKSGDLYEFRLVCGNSLK